MAKIANKDILQSYILTTAKYDFSVYEKRFLYRLVELAQSEMEGLIFKNDCRKIDHDLFGFTKVTLPIASMLKDEDDKNHIQVKKALQSLQKKLITYEDDNVWESISIIGFPVIKKFASTISCTLHPKIWDCILNFSKGYRKFELQTAMQFDSIYSMRFYELMSEQKTPLEYKIEDFKNILQLQNKYKQINDFIKRVVEPAKKELDSKSPYSFTYSIIKEGRQYKNIRFYPIYQPKFRDSDLDKKDLQKQVSPAWDLPKNTLDYLKNGFQFTTKEIKQNIDLLKQAQNEMENFINFMSQVKPRANRASNPKGYLINSIKKELKVI